MSNVHTAVKNPPNPILPSGAQAKDHTLSIVWMILNMYCLKFNWNMLKSPSSVPTNGYSPFHITGCVDLQPLKLFPALSY